MRRGAIAASWRMAIVRVVQRRGEPAPGEGPFAWWMVRLASPLVPTFRELLEMRYLWNEPVRMDNARLRALLGREPHTPLGRRGGRHAGSHRLPAAACRETGNPGLRDPQTASPLSAGRPFVIFSFEGQSDTLVLISKHNSAPDRPRAGEVRRSGHEKL